VVSSPSQLGNTGRQGTVKRYDKVLERLGRLKQRYSHAAQYFEDRVEQDVATGKATAICWQRTQPIAETFPSAYCLLNYGHEWDESTL
jgi:hypothetical protein